MDIILVPGMWLDGSAWAEVADVLAEAGHRPRALTLPGMEAVDADRSGITLRDHVDAVVTAIDAVGEGADDPPKVLLVGHSAAAGIAWSAVDARPERVARAVLVSGFPGGDGEALAAGYPADRGEVPFPDWSAFGDEDLADLDDDGRAALRARAIPFPEHVVTDPQRLTDDRRFAVPVTAVATEYTTDDLRSAITDGPDPEFAAIEDVEYVDLPTGHWPMLTRPRELAEVILAAARA